jgi:hypothetical protein
MFSGKFCVPGIKGSRFIRGIIGSSRLVVNVLP